MRLNVNLATRPYEDVRKFVARWGTLTVLLALVTAVLLYMAISSYRDSRIINAQIADKQQKIDALEKDRTNAVDTLNKPENKAVAGTSRFFNDAIQRKSLSWTRVFMDLERIMPPGLHVISISPELTKDNQLVIRLFVGGSSHQRAVELVQKMEQSSTFRRPQLHAETMTVNTPDPVQFEITSNYVPSQAAPEPTRSEAQPSPSQTVAQKGATR